MKKGKKNGKNSSSDSGISDYSGGFSDSDIPVREEQLTKLKLMANNLQQNLSPNSSALTLISQTLETTSCELKDLQKSYKKYKKTNKKPKLQQTAKCKNVRQNKVTSSILRFCI